MDQLRWMLATEADLVREQRARRRVLALAGLLLVAGCVLLISAAGPG